MPEVISSQSDIDRALFDPGSVFETPNDVVGHPSLTLKQKVEILRRWAYDDTEMAVAEDERMGGSAAIPMESILVALHQFTGGYDSKHTAPTKHAAF